jgi:hypothetical protein
MNADVTVFNLLRGDATLLSESTGGIYLYTDLGKLGFVRASKRCEQAFDDNGILRPSVIVKSRPAIPDYKVHDVTNLYVSSSQVVEIWMYDDGDKGDGTLSTMSDRIFALLQDQIYDSMTFRQSTVVSGLRDPILEGALCRRNDFQAFGAV